MGTSSRDARDLLARMALISYGGVQRLGATRGGDPERAGPPGESAPMHERWAQRFDGATDDALPDLIAQGRAELDAWRRRRFPVRASETWDDLAARIVTDGWGVSANECARAMRCTPSMVRRARLAAHRNPDTGYPLPEANGDAMAWARELDHVGLSSREVERLTGIPRRTFAYRVGRP